MFRWIKLLDKITVISRTTFRNHFLNQSTLRNTNADLKISLYVCVHLKGIPRKFRISNPKNY